MPHIPPIIKSKVGLKILVVVVVMLVVVVVVL
jgi:hypothetical protein